MQFVSCGKGHYYNPVEYAACPQCARENAALQSSGFSMDSVGATEPIGGYQPAGSPGATEPVFGFQSGMGGFDTVGVTEPVEGFRQGYRGSGSPMDDFCFADTDQDQMQGYAPTTFLAPDSGSTTSGSQQARIRPVVGWLVCVDGPARGRDYRIHGQNNYIGRARHMDICIEGDSSISSERAATLAYDDLQKVFFFAPGQGLNLVRRNGRAMLSPVELQSHDRLTIGKSTFLFIPLCGERFDWNDQDA